MGQAQKTKSAQGTRNPAQPKRVQRKPAQAKPGQGKLKITLVTSPIGFDKTQAKTVQGMGLRRINHSVELLDTPETRGMILKVRHLATVQEQQWI